MYVLVLEPDPRKIGKEGLVNWLGWKCTLHPVCRHTSDWLLQLAFLMYIRNANRTKAVFEFCFALESCKTKQVRLECWCLVLQKALLATVGSTINKIPNILQCTLPPCPIYQTLFSIFRGSGSETRYVYTSTNLPFSLRDLVSCFKKLCLHLKKVPHHAMLKFLCVHTGSRWGGCTPIRNIHANIMHTLTLAWLVLHLTSLV